MKQKAIASTKWVNSDIPIFIPTVSHPEFLKAQNIVVSVKESPQITIGI